MTRALIVAAGLGLGVSGANACDFHDTAHSTADQTTVASIAAPEEIPATIIVPTDDAVSPPPAETQQK